jgi:hypothetical protein
MWIREWAWIGIHSKVTQQCPENLLLSTLSDGFDWREKLHTCRAWRVSQNLLMVLALVWQDKALQAMVAVVKLWQPVARLGGAESRYEDRMSPWDP